jgi:hypothetical protein
MCLSGTIWHAAEPHHFYAATVPGKKFVCSSGSVFEYTIKQNKIVKKLTEELKLLNNL